MNVCFYICLLFSAILISPHKDAVTQGVAYVDFITNAVLLL